MGRKCIVIKCRSGYDPSYEERKFIMAGGENLCRKSVFRFPAKKDLRVRWLKAISRNESFCNLDYAGVCELHFRREDFHTSEITCHGTKRKRISLKTNSVPSIFNNHPNYLQPVKIKSKTSWTEKTVFLSHYLNKKKRLRDLNEVILEEDKELSEQNEELSQCVQDLVKKGKYSPQQVFVVEQTQVWWGCLPTNKDVVGHTLTILLCFNAKGDCRLTPLVVGHQGRPEALKNTRMSCLPVVWRANRQARVTSMLFDDWFVNHFVPAAHEHCRTNGLPERGLLLVRTISGHPHYPLDEGGFKVAYLSSDGPWPLQQGVADTLSRHYLRLGVQSVAQPHSKINMWDIWKKVDIKLALRNITLSWNLMSQETLNSAWSGMWPGVVHSTSRNPPQDILPLIKNNDIHEPDESVLEKLVKTCQKELREYTLHDVSKISVSLEDEGEDVTTGPQVLTPWAIREILRHIDEACRLVKDEEGSQELCKQLKEASKEYSDLLLSMKDSMDTDPSNLSYSYTRYEEVETGEE